MDHFVNPFSVSLHRLFNSLLILLQILKYRCSFSDQADARRLKNKEMRRRREERIALKKKEMLSALAKEDEAAKKE